jgi:hypothetical protein
VQRQIDLVNDDLEDVKPKVSIKAEAASEDDYNWENAGEDDYSYAEEVPEKKERERSREKNERPEFVYSLDKTIRQVEPPSDRLSLEDYEALRTARLKWIKLAQYLQVSPVCTVMCVATGTSDRTEEEKDCAGKGTKLMIEETRTCGIWAIDIDSPEWEMALRGTDRERWLDAMQSQLNSLTELGVNELVERPKDRDVITGKWVLKLKRTSTGEIGRYIARYVARGFDQQEGVDYSLVWTPTGQHATLKVLLVHAVSTNLEMRHVDISTALPYGELDETVYVEQPPELNDGNTNRWRLRKSLYGLKQAGRQWHLRLSHVLREKGFKRVGNGPALYVSESTAGEKQFIFLWVDDLFLVALKEVYDAIAQEVLSTFKGRDLGEASWLLGMKITRDRTRKTLELSQGRRIETALERFNMTQCRTSAVPMDLSE